MKRLLTTLLLSTSILLYSNIFALDNRPWVNILTWWGYLDDPQIKEEISKTCNVNVSFDEYYTNEQFLSSFNKNTSNYDIIIFSNLLYPIIKDRININDSELWKTSNNYYPYFKTKYQKDNYDHNVVYFTHSMMGFLYNPQNINIQPNDNIFKIFKNAENKYVILVDDPAENANLLRVGTKNKNSDFNYNNFKAMTQNALIYVTNDFNKIYSLNSFAFSFMWSGDALETIKEAKVKYRFVLNPQLSYVCTDLLAQLNRSKQATCAAKVLASKETAAIVEKSTYYFTPYFENNMPEDTDFTELYNNTKSMLGNLSWIKQSTLPEFSSESNTWEEIKIKINDSNTR